MDQEISVPTPESVDFSHEPAGIGSRFVASIVDIALQVSAIILVILIGGLWSSSLEALAKSLGSWGTAIAVILTFLLLWGYNIIFEMRWNGQTPGKRIAGIRVLKDGGYPISFLDSIVRNLLRPVDFLPFFYGAGAVVVFLNKRCKRIGDYAAGTIVVRERKVATPLSLQSSAINVSGEILIGGQRLTNVHDLSEAEIEVVRKFMVRRHSIQKEARSALAKRIARSLVKKLDISPKAIENREEEFLEKIAWAYGKSKL